MPIEYVCLMHGNKCIGNVRNRLIVICSILCKLYSDINEELINQEICQSWIHGSMW